LGLADFALTLLRLIRLALFSLGPSFSTGLSSACRIVFLFGLNPIDFGLPVGFPQFQVQTVAGCTFLYAPAIEESRTDKLLKSKLWVSLRSIFGI